MNRRTALRRFGRIPAWLALATMGSGLVVMGNVLDARAADPSFPVLLEGGGDTDVIAELNAWKNTMQSAEQPTEFSYFEGGTAASRRALLDGSADFAIVGVPFTAAELAGRPAGAGELIDVPISVASLSVIITEPFSTGGFKIVTDQLEPFCADDPTDCPFRLEPYLGPIRIPPDNLAALVMNLPASFRDNRLTDWDSPGMMANNADGKLSIQRPEQRDVALGRVDDAAVNKYLMEYFKELGPEAWALVKANYPSDTYEPIRERMTTHQKARFSFTLQVASIMKNATVDSFDGTQRPTEWAGNIGAIPTTYVQQLATDFPDIKYRVVEIQNKHGDWLKADRATLDASLGAGSTPNIGASQDVEGAYPLVYINHLYAVAGTLSPDAANSLAASIRFMTTDGQQAIIDHGGTTLTPALQAEALAQADRVVETNCTAEGYEVVTSGPSTFEPDTPQVQAIASMKHCVVVVPPAPTTTTTTTTTTTPETTTTSTTVVATTTTTIAASTTSTPALTTTTEQADLSTSPEENAAQPGTAQPRSPPPPNTQSPTVTTPAPTEPTETPVANSVAEETTTAAPTTEAALQVTTTVRARGVALSELPMQRPSDGSNGPKELGTLMLGSAMFLGPRKYFVARRDSR